MSMNRDTDSLLQAGIAAVRGGDKREGARLLAQVVRKEPQSEDAWFWLAAATDQPAEAAACLRRVLAINPNNGRAQQALEMLDSGQGAAAFSQMGNDPTPNAGVVPPPGMRPLNTGELLSPAGGFNQPPPPPPSFGNGNVNAAPPPPFGTPSWAQNDPDATTRTTLSNDPYGGATIPTSAAAAAAPPPPFTGGGGLRLGQLDPNAPNVPPPVPAGLPIYDPGSELRASLLTPNPTPYPGSGAVTVQPVAKVKRSGGFGRRKDPQVVAVGQPAAVVVNNNNPPKRRRNPLLVLLLLLLAVLAMGAAALFALSRPADPVITADTSSQTATAGAAAGTGGPGSQSPGATGAAGATGVAGAAGASGTGAAGASGTGVAGATGAAGASGTGAAAGATAVAGASGTPGAAGTGVAGTSGAAGTGATAASGTPGAAGTGAAGTGAAGSLTSGGAANPGGTGGQGQPGTLPPRTTAVAGGTGAAGTPGGPTPTVQSIGFPPLGGTTAAAGSTTASGSAAGQTAAPGAPTPTVQSNPFATAAPGGATPNRPPGGGEPIPGVTPGGISIQPPATVRDNLPPPEVVNYLNNTRRYLAYGRFFESAIAEGIVKPYRAGAIKPGLTRINIPAVQVTRSVASTTAIAVTTSAAATTVATSPTAEPGSGAGEVTTPAATIPPAATTPAVITTAAPGGGGGSGGTGTTAAPGGGATTAAAGGTTAAGTAKPVTTAALPTTAAPGGTAAAGTTQAGGNLSRFREVIIQTADGPQIYDYDIFFDGPLELSLLSLNMGRTARIMKDVSTPAGAYEVNLVALEYANTLTYMSNALDLFFQTGQVKYLEELSNYYDKAQRDRERWERIVAAGYPYRVTL